MPVETPVDSGAEVVCECCLSSVLFRRGKLFFVLLKQYVTSYGYSFHCCYVS